MSSSNSHPLLPRDFTKAFYDFWAPFILIGIFVWCFISSVVISCVIESWQAKIWRRIPSPLYILPRRIYPPEERSLSDDGLPPPMTLDAERGSTNAETTDSTAVPNPYTSLADGLTLVDSSSIHTQVEFGTKWEEQSRAINLSRPAARQGGLPGHRSWQFEERLPPFTAAAFPSHIAEPLPVYQH